MHPSDTAHKAPFVRLFSTRAFWGQRRQLYLYYATPGILTETCTWRENSNSSITNNQLAKTCSHAGSVRVSSHFQHRHVQSAASQIKHKYQLVFKLVQSIRQCRRLRLAQQFHLFQTCKLHTRHQYVRVCKECCLGLPRALDLCRLDGCWAPLPWIVGFKGPSRTDARCIGVNIAGMVESRAMQGNKDTLSWKRQNGFNSVC
jgi:hypothetical protein